MKKIILLVWLLVFSVGSFSSEVEYKDEVKEYFVENKINNLLQGVIWYYAAIEKYTKTENVIEKAIYKLDDLGIAESIQVSRISYKGNFNDLSMVDEWRKGRNVKNMKIVKTPMDERLKKTVEKTGGSLLHMMEKISRFSVVNNQMITTAHNHRKLGYFDFETKSPWDLTGKITIFGTRKPIQYLNKTQALYIRGGKALIVTFKEQVSDGKAIAIVFGEPTEYTTALGVKKIAATAYEL